MINWHPTFPFIIPHSISIHNTVHITIRVKYMNELMYLHLYAIQLIKSSTVVLWFDQMPIMPTFAQLYIFYVMKPDINFVSKLAHNGIRKIIHYVYSETLNLPPTTASNINPKFMSKIRDLSVQIKIGFNKDEIWIKVIFLGNNGFIYLTIQKTILDFTF